MKAQIKDIYTYSSANSLPLLGSNNFDFWADYLENYSVYDRYFRDSFMRFLYWIDFEDDETISGIHADFASAVQSFIMLNKKRYAELYRVQALAENAYDIVNNYDLTENITRTNTGTVQNAIGAQSNSYSKGAQSSSDIYGAENRSTTEGAQSNSYSKGAQSNIDVYGAESKSTVEGEQSNSHTDNKNAYTDTHTHSVAPYDDGFSEETQDVDSMGAQGGTASDTIGEKTTTQTSQSKTDTHSSIAYIDGESIGEKTTTQTSQSKTDTHSSNAYTDDESIGARNDTRTDNLTETVTTTKSGNIGVQTAAEIIGGHIDLWNRFNFYKMLFDEVAKEYLMISDDYTGYSTSYTSETASTILAAINALSAKIDDVEESINANIDEAEANIRGDIVEVSTNGY